MKKFCIGNCYFTNKHLRKILLTMKITTLLLLLTILQSTANVLSQTISVDVRNQSMRDVLRMIETQTDYRFFYNDQLSGLNTPVTIKAENKTLEEVLNQLLDKQQFSYTAMENKMIVIVPKEFMQQKSITGAVTDIKGDPLPGVNVVVKGTSIGTITDTNGYFRIDTPNDAQVLVFSFIGMKTQEVDITDKISVDVILEQEAIGIDEVIAIGYGVAKKATLTGSVSSIQGERITSTPLLNVTNALAGQVPGLVVITPSGEPGQDESTLRVRGLNTLGNNNPLIVVDGIANRNFDRLNASDIESITVLKDASAAIYGAQAANGVILITTKRGSITKREFNFTVNQGWAKPVIVPDICDAAQYAEALNDFNRNQGAGPAYSEDEIRKFRDGSDPWMYPNIRLYDQIYRKLAPQTNIYGSAMGGSETMAYFVSIGYRYQDAIYQNSNTDFSQFDFRTNIDGKISDNVKISFDINGSQRDDNQPNADKTRMWRTFVRTAPTVAAIWPDGRLGSVGGIEENPFAMTTNISGYNKSKLYDLRSNLKLDIAIPWVEGLSIIGNASVDKLFTESKLLNKSYTYYRWDRTTYDTDGNPLLGEGIATVRGMGVDPNLSIEHKTGESITLNSLIDYKRRFSDNHNIGVLLGAERTVGESKYLMAYRRYFPSAALDELIAGGDEEQNNTGYSSSSARLNYFGRFNYNYANKYLVELIFRYDGSYIFPAEGRYGFFPGVSLGWNIAEEDFWRDNISVIPYFKLRGSYGKTGNDRIQEFQYTSNFGFVELKEFGTRYLLNENQIVQTLDELRVPNTLITWEESNQFNFGVDAIVSGFSFSMDYFYYHRNNILLYRRASVPAMVGFTLPRENIGEVINRGIDGQLGYTNVYGKISYGVTVNLGYARNNIKFWDEEPNVPEYQKSTGKPIGSLLLYEAIGVFRDQEHVDSYPSYPGAVPGDIIFKDVNGDDVINDLDRVRQSNGEVPTFTGGTSFNFSYGDFYTSIHLQGAAGGKRLRFQRVGPGLNWLNNDLEGRWTLDNPDAKKPRVSDEGIYWDAFAENNTFFLDKNDYLRLKNIEVGYNVRNIKGMKGEIRIFFNGQNLLTYTGMTDYDPETPGSEDVSYPQNKVYNIGISLTY